MSIDKKNIVLIWDYDGTMTEHTCQTPMLSANMKSLQQKYGIINPDDYWESIDLHRSSGNQEVEYLQKILLDIKTKVLTRDGNSITEKDLQYFGSLVQMAPGIFEFLKEIKDKWSDKVNICIYVISIGMQNLILGSGIAEYVDDIYASKFTHRDYDDPKLDDTDLPINWIKKIVTSFGKTAPLIEIAKGKPASLNVKLSAKDYRFQYRDMIVIGDGYSDLSVFSYVRKKGGHVIGVYEKGNKDAFETSHQKIGYSIDYLLERDYTPNRTTAREIHKMIGEIVENKRCDFSPELLHMYRKGAIRDQETMEYVDIHIRECPYCSDIVTTSMMLPK
jgi:hypothetical protein